jgi:hypothetical protein
VAVRINTMKISIFKNENKREGHRDPDYSGNITDDNGKIIHYVVLWENTSKTGLKYLNGKVNEPREKQAQGSN